MAYPKDRKWLLICQQRAQLQAPATTPKDFVAQLKQPKVKSSTISHVASSLNGEPKAWVQGFLEEGGLGILTDLLNTRVDKEKYAWHTFYQAHCYIP